MNELAHPVSLGGVDAFESPSHPRSLLLETTATTVVTLALVRGLHTSGIGLNWLLIPCMLVTAALGPAWIAQREFPHVGLHVASIRLAIKTVALTCSCILPPVFLGLWLLASQGLPIPLRPTLADGESCLPWLLYQFLYVAAAEEVFFRGYLQTNVMRLLREHRLSRPARQWLALAISAGLFALAHVVVQGQIVSALTFLPGLLMGWLFVRTRSLLAPILFHGLANVSYGILAATLA